MAQNRYIFLPPNSLDSPTHDTSIINIAESTSNFVLQECWDFTWRVSDSEELVGASKHKCD